MKYEEEKLLEMNERLRQCVDRVSEAKRCEKLLRSARHDLDILNRSWLTLKETLQKEEQDVEKLQKLTLSNLIHTIMNNKVEKIDKEKQEALTAKLKCDSAYIQLEECRHTIERLEEKRKTLHDAEQAYQKVLDEKQTFISEYMPDKRDKMKNMMDEAATLSSQLKEVDEAVQAGHMALSEVRGAVNALQSAKNWGTWDMLGGGLIATVAKHGRMEEAQSCIYRMQNNIRRFSRELQDIDMYMAESDLDIGSFLKFADYFFDGFFVDWAVQSKINNALDHVMDIQSRIEGIQRNLRDKHKDLTKKVETLESKIKDLIARA